MQKFIRCNTIVECANDVQNVLKIRWFLWSRGKVCLTLKYTANLSMCNLLLTVCFYYICTNAQVNTRNETTVSNLAFGKIQFVAKKLQKLNINIS